LGWHCDNWLLYDDVFSKGGIVDGSWDGSVKFKSRQWQTASSAEKLNSFKV